LANNKIIITGKLAHANYITIFTKDESKVFDAETNTSGWCNGFEGMEVPTHQIMASAIKQSWQNLLTDTALLNEEAAKILLKMLSQLNSTECTNSVYKLPNTKQVMLVPCGCRLSN
jgi:hypothetical protein